LPTNDEIARALAQVKHALPHAACLNLWRLLVVIALWLWALKTRMTAARRFNLFL
jgi:hypothetical protein